MSGLRNAISQTAGLLQPDSRFCIQHGHRQVRSGTFHDSIDETALEKHRGITVGSRLAIKHAL